MTSQEEKELAKELNKVLDLTYQIDGLRGTINSLKKDIKDTYELPATTITKILAILKKENLEEEDENWELVKKYVDLCK